MNCSFFYQSIKTLIFEIDSEGLPFALKATLFVVNSSAVLVV